MPLPPYITEKLKDKSRYQTIYAKHLGSAAAPTAGLHFTDEVFATLGERGYKHRICHPFMWGSEPSARLRKKKSKIILCTPKDIMFPKHGRADQRHKKGRKTRYLHRYNQLPNP